MPRKRVYNYRDVEVLFGSRIAFENFLRNLPELSRVFTHWTEEKVHNAIHQVDEGIKLLGIDPQLEVQKATRKMNEVQEPALHELAFFKKVIPVLFKKDGKNILKQLGFNKYHKDAIKGDQEALFNLLVTFNDGMAGELKAQIEEKGINPEILEGILSYKDKVYLSNVKQETLKGSSQEITQECIDVFNAIYLQAIDVCKLASAYYASNPIKRNQFTFSRIVKNMNAIKSSSNDKEKSGTN
ncbi:MAG: hypothetical protein ACOCTM_02075 [Bacteroidota bacterium]